MRTEAAVLVKTGIPLRLVPVGIPELQPGQVLVDVAYSGVCRSQLLEVRGRRGPDQYLPHALGHEGAGVVLETGRDVRKVRPGDRVVLSWIKGTGADVPSMQYPSAFGGINSGALATFMRTAVTCENRVTRVSDDLPLRAAALLGCAVPTGAGAVLNVARVEPGRSLVVFGLGGVGLSAIMAGALVNAATIIAVDVVRDKLAQAEALGATHTVDAATIDAAAAVMTLTGGRGVDYAVEAAGHPDAMLAAFAVTRESGGICVLTGNLPRGSRIPIDPFDLIRGKRLVGTWGGDTDPERDIPRYAELYRRGKLPVDRLVTHVYSLDGVNRALNDLEAGHVGRALIDMSMGAPEDRP